MAADFPASLPNIPNAGSTLGTTGGASSHATLHTRIEEEVLAIATRLAVPSVATMTLASLVTGYGSGHPTPSSTLSAGFVCTRGMLVNGTGSTQTPGTAVAQLSSSLHWPASTMAFTTSYDSGATTMLMYVNTSGQLIIDQPWPNTEILNVGGFVWWV